MTYEKHYNGQSWVVEVKADNGLTVERLKFESDYKASQYIREHKPKESKEVEAKQPKTGDKSICQSCNNEIVFTGDYWEHQTGEVQPRHMGTPVANHIYNDLQKQKPKGSENKLDTGSKENKGIK